MTVKVGVVGLGVWGQVHCDVYDSHPQAQLAAVCDIDAERANEAAEQYQSQAFSDHQSMLSEMNLDAVAVATPDFAHRDIAVDAASAGKHLIIEKPLATSVKDAEDIQQAVRDAGVLCMVDFHNRWNPMFVSVYDSLQNGELGEPAHMYIRHSNTFYVPSEMLSWSNQSSVAWFLGAHSADLARWLAGSEPARVSCVSREGTLQSKGIDAPDFFLTTLEFENGAVAMLENSWLLPDSLPTLGDFKAEVVGTDGVAYVDHTTNRAVQIFHKEETLPGVASGNFFRESIRHFVQCVAGGTEPSVTIADGLANTRIICAMLESAETAKPVDL